MSVFHAKQIQTQATVADVFFFSFFLSRSRFKNDLGMKMNVIYQRKNYFHASSITVPSVNQNKQNKVHGAATVCNGSESQFRIALCHWSFKNSFFAD